MSLRLLGCSLLLIALGAFKIQTSRTAPPEQKPETLPKWEYNVVKLEANQCASGLGILLDTAGRDGWDLVTYERFAPPPVPLFPTEAQGTLLISPAATGSGRYNNPQTADSFQGKIELKMPPVQPPPPQPGGCQFIFKRQRLKPNQ